MPHLYGHRYLGPGSSLSDTDKPVDIDDFYALIHDVAYEVATNRDDIRQADRDAILNFLGDFIANSNWHSLLGSVGLATKYGIETVVGVLYPQIHTDGMPPVKDWAKIRRIQAAIDAQLVAQGKPPKYNWGNKTGGISKKGKANKNTLKKQSKPTTTTTEDPFEGDDSHWPEQIEEPQLQEPQHKKQRVEDPIADLDRLDQLLDAINQDDQPGTNIESRAPSGEQRSVQTNSDNVVPGTSGIHASSSTSRPSPPLQSIMDTMDADGEAVNPSGSATRVVSANSGGSASASGGPGQNQSYIRGPYKSLGTGRFHLEKKFRFRCYGYAWGTSNLNAPDGSSPAVQRTIAKGINTSLIFMPTDYLPLYMSQAEWTFLGGMKRVSVESCNITIIPAGYNVSFDTNSTLTGAASATHFVEAKYAKGLNEIMPIRAVKYTSEATEPMVISNTANVGEDDIINLLYFGDHNQMTVQGNSWPWYAQFVQHTSTMDYTYYDKANFGSWQDYGSLTLSQHMTVGALQGMLNNPIHMNFTPKLGIIMNQYQNPGFPLSGSKWQDQNQWFTNPNELLSSGGYTPATKQHTYSMTTRSQKRKAIVAKWDGTDAKDSQPFIWQQRIDKSGQMGWLNANGPSATQIPPVLLFGISPIKSSLPSGARPNSYVQAHCDFYVETSMEIVINNSTIGSNWPIGSFKDCLFGAVYTNQTTTYSDIATFGLFPSLVGTASANKQN